ncbi:hypothetical protein [Peribacillus simplex]|uniref:hypothetical protein n=1 Tax=Peribacillus simplex TaxID=1478 RepID=UPI000A52681D
MPPSGRELKWIREAKLNACLMTIQAGADPFNFVLRALPVAIILSFWDPVVH